MKLKEILLILSNLFIISLLLLYWVVPLKNSTFKANISANTNFTISENKTKVQFYENMRFPSKMISYKIKTDCNLEKTHSMERGFERIANLTGLIFYPVDSNEQITVTCQEKNIIENGMFIAGEGGPTNITNTDKFKVITHGDILLIKESDCPNPNVEIHELLHVLGFDHSENKKNIMYPISKCDQTIGEDTIEKIKDLYKTPSLPDLKFEKIEANVKGRILNINISVRNDGLKESKETKISLISENKTLREIDLKPLQIGHGLKIELKNLWITKIKIEELRVEIDSNFEELSKDNNKVLLSKTTN